MKILDKLEQLEKAATPGPWAWGPKLSEDEEKDDIDHINDRDGDPVIVRDSGVYPPDVPTAEMIIAARNALPQLIRVARAAEDVLKLSVLRRPGHFELRQALESLNDTSS